MCYATTTILYGILIGDQKDEKSKGMDNGLMACIPKNCTTSLLIFIFIHCISASTFFNKGIIV